MNGQSAHLRPDTAGQPDLGLAVIAVQQMSWTAGHCCTWSRQGEVASALETGALARQDAGSPDHSTRTLAVLMILIQRSVSASMNAFASSGLEPTG